ncbi:MAG: SWIM zinc finger domain-containing protein, partial [Vampirovibrionia bacterium]
MIKFNFQYIRNLASPGVWRRGYSYYQTKQVESVELCEQGIVGKVKGNFRDEYTTILTLSEDHVKAECDCPFPDEWCKHAVAVALIGISEGLWDKFWGIEEEVPDNEEYEGNYRFFFSKRSKPKTVVVKVVDRKKNETITQIEPILRSVVEAQKQNIIQLSELEKREFYLLTFLHKLAQLDKKRKHYYVAYNNLNDLMACFATVEEVRDMHSKQRLTVEKNTLKLIMNVNISLVGNVLVALHWKRTNPEDIIPYEEVKLFAKRVQWGVYDNTFFPIETKVGELPYFLSKSSFLDIRGGDGGKFLFEQLPKFKETLEGELELEESEIVQNARLEVRSPKKVLTIEMPNETTLRAALEFDYDGVRVPYAPTMKGAPYVCVVKGAPEQKQYSIEEFREQEAAQRKADIEAGLIDPEKEKKKVKKVIRIKVVDKKDKSDSKEEKKAAKAIEPEVIEEIETVENQIAEEVEFVDVIEPSVVNETSISKSYTPDDRFDAGFEGAVVFNNVDFSEYDDDDFAIIPDASDFVVQEDNFKPHKEEVAIINEPEEFAFDDEADEIKETIVTSKDEVKPEPPMLFKQVSKPVVKKVDSGSLDSLIDNLITSSKSNPLSADMVTKKKTSPKRHEVVEDLDLLDKLMQEPAAKTKKLAVEDNQESDDKTTKKRGRPPKKANKEFEPIEETIITNNDDFYEDSEDDAFEEQENEQEIVSEPSIVEEPKEVYWIKRDIDLERKTFKELNAASLTPMQTNKLEALNDNLIEFVGKFLPHLINGDDWIVECPEEVSRIRIADDPLKFKVNVDFGPTHA